MLLGSRNIVSGDVRRITIDYTDFLPRGVVLATTTVTLMLNGAGTITSSVAAPMLTDNKQGIYFLLTGGSALNEAFTANIQVTDTYGEKVNDTLNFTVVSPGTG